MQQYRLTPHQRLSARKARRGVACLPDFRTLPGGLEYWGEVRDRLQAMHYYGTTDGKPWVEPVKPHSVDSACDGFVMPDDWHCRRVDAINGPQIWPNVRLLGWDPSGQAKRPYCVEDVQGHSLWVEHIRFADGDVCDWSDDGTVEPC